jgi:hypothetical protein
MLNQTPCPHFSSVARISSVRYRTYERVPAVRMFDKKRVPNGTHFSRAIEVWSPHSNRNYQGRVSNQASGQGRTDSRLFCPAQCMALHVCQRSIRRAVRDTRRMRSRPSADARGPMKRRHHGLFGTRAELQHTALVLIAQGYTEATRRKQRGPYQYYMGAEDPDQPKENQYILIWETDY